MKESEFDVLVVGAGIGGLSVASILAKEGLKVAVLEREDRVGGRALSIEGSEISDKGADWYYGILERHYSYLAHSEPDVDSIVEGRMLDGYILDLGFHAIGFAGKAHLGRLVDYLGIDVSVNPCKTGFYYKGEYYTEPGPPALDEKLQRICEEKGLDYWSFFIHALSKGEEEQEELEKTSVYDYCRQFGLTEDDVVWQSLRCLGTLLTTINNPHEISAGEGVRAAKEFMFPIVATGEEFYLGGFIVGGVMKWSQAVAAELERLGGALILGAEVKGITVEGDHVTGVDIWLPEEGPAHLRSSRVVSSIPIQHTFDLVEKEHFPPEFVSRATSLYGCGSLTPYFGLRELPLPEDHARTIIKTPRVVSTDEGFDYDIYMGWNVQSAVDPDCAPPGKHLFTAYLPLTEEESLDREKAMRLVEEVPRFLERAYPGFNDCVEWALYPMCWKLEGVAKSISQAGVMKPSVKAPGLNGLYFAGDTALGFGVAMDCACSSGINCAAAILGRKIGIE